MGITKKVVAIPAVDCHERDFKKEGWIHFRAFSFCPSPPPKHSQLKEPYEMLNKTKTQTTIARQKTAKEKALKCTNQTGKEPYENRCEKNRALHNVEKNKKTTKKMISDRRRPGGS